MRLTNLNLIVATFDHDEMPEGAKRYLTQCSNYPVRNGSGHSVDEAVEDWCLQVLVHLHNLRTGRRD